MGRDKQGRIRSQVTAVPARCLWQGDFTPVHCMGLKLRLRLQCRESLVSLKQNSVLCLLEYDARSLPFVFIFFIYIVLDFFFCHKPQKSVIVSPVSHSGNFYTVRII